MEKIVTYKGESVVDAAIRAYGHIEGVVPYAIENGVALDFEETTGAVERLVNNEVRTELKTKRPAFNQIPEKKISSVLVNSDQNIIDMAIQETGSIEGLISFLRLNSLSPSAELVAGTSLKVKGADIIDPNVTSFYKQLNLKVNTGFDGQQGEQEGIFDYTFDFTFE